MAAITFDTRPTGSWVYEGGLLFMSAPKANPSKPEAGKPITPSGDKLLTTQEAAALLGLSPRTLEGLRRRGDGPPFKALSRNVVRYGADELKAWIDGRTVEHTARARAIHQSR